MQPRDFLLLIGGGVLAASLGILLLGGAPEVVAGVRDEAPEPTPTAPVEGVARKSEPVEAIAAPMPRDPVVAMEGDLHGRGKGVDTSNWTAGVIVGDIQLATSVLDRLTTIQVVVEELRNQPAGGDPKDRPRRLVVPVELGRGTPTFRVADVPFSPYSYCVRVHAPGLNGSRQTVSITQEHPYEDGVKLAITPGVPYSLLLRDQDLVPIANTEVSMLPIGEPLGRPSYQKTTDNFGSVAHDYVLAGDYRVFVGPVSQPLTDPVEITVQPAGVVFVGGKVQSQGTTVTVPRGVELAVLVSDIANYSLADASIRLQATDRLRSTPIEGRTDGAGRWRMPHLQAGTWQIDVSKEDHDRQSRQITVKDGEPLPELRFQLSRLR